LDTPLDLIRAAYRLARQHYLRLILPALAGHTLAAFARRLALTDPALHPLVPIALIVGPALIFLGEAAPMLHCADLARGRPLSPVLPRLRPALPALLLGALTKWFQVLGGLVLLVLPGMYLLCRLFAVPAMTLLEGLDVRGAYRRSALLAQREPRRILATVGLHDALLLVLPTVAQLLLLGFGVPIPLWSWYLLWLVPALLSPARVALVILTCFDARERMESEAPGGVAPFPF